MSTQPKEFQELKTRLIEVSDLNGANAVLGWDQQTYMPPGGAAARGRQTATLARIAHEKFTDPAIGKLLDALRPYEESLPFEHDYAALIRVTRRGYERQIKLPSEFVARLNEHIAASFQTWAQARPANDFKATQPFLEKTLDLSREISNYFPGYEHIADPLIDFADYGMKASSIRDIFARLREQLVPIAQAITAQAPADDSFMYQDYPEKSIEAFSLGVAQQFGYDLNRGRLDKVAHPFCTTFSISDVRITTRYPKNDLSDPLFSTFHESGHAMYEQGGNPAYEGTSLAGGTSSGVHESQSRLWENIVGRSHPFWEHYFPKLQATFPAQLGSVTLDQFYRAVNKVERSLIRTEADEVTYNLHVMIRFDLELQMLEGKLPIRDLPEAWQARYQSDLGVSAPDNRDGVLQDIHWYGGVIGGAFQGYTLGNILSAQFYTKALQVHPEIPMEIGRGKFDTLYGWLRDNIYWHGSKFTANELTDRVLGGPLSIEPYIAYLRAKYGQLYTL